ncbi:MAG: amidohydrolase family protein [Myxococcales bacterium]|nr:amidohydrolase family protein [Myxococcales bacterium]
MEGRLVLKGCSIFRADGRVRAGMAILVQGTRVSKVAPDEEIPTLPGDWEVSCRGRLVTSGLVDCHAHLVGGQVAPLSGDLMLRPPAARLELRHRIERDLSSAEVEALTAFALARALRSGVTMSVELLHAPKAVGDSLAVQARTAERLGARLVNSHASSSALGEAAALEQLEANAHYARERKGHSLVRGALGFHSSHLCDDELLRRLGRAREEIGVGVHCHLAENDDDLTVTYSRYGKRVVNRLDYFGLLGPGAVAAHARAIDRSEAQRLAKSRTVVALSARESLAEASWGGTEALLAHQGLVGLGTGGCGTLWEELHAALTGVIALARSGRLLDPDGLLAQLFVGGPAELCSMLFGAPSGSVEDGSLADLVVFDHVPSTVGDGGSAPHLLQQLGQAPVAWTVVGGRVTVREGQLLGADYLELAREAARALESAWSRADTLPPPA